MYLQFTEEFDQPISEIYPYFATPADWSKLYGQMKPGKDLGNSWYSVPLKTSPFPLVAKNVSVIPEKQVRWIFGSFWRGVGEVNFSSQNGKTIVQGYEYITAHGAWIFASLIERIFMQKEFERIWDMGWKRLRKIEK